MPPKLKRSRSGTVAVGKRVKKALAPIQRLPVDLQAYIALFLRYPEEVRMHFLWPKKALHTPWYMERRVSDIIYCKLLLNWYDSQEAARRYSIYKENTRDYPVRLVNSGSYGNIFLFRNSRWGVSGYNDDRLSWTPERFASAGQESW